MKYLAHISRLVFGLVFVFSGFVKAIDPLGSTYKIQDYLEAFGMPFPEPVSLIFAFVLSSSEFLLGVSLLLGLFMRFTSWVALVFISGFTVLTFVIALTNPVSDCGCFGDALILTNWQTFFKNIILLALAILVFLYRNKFKSLYRPLSECGWLALFLGAIAILSLYCYRHLPIIDFRPYSIGTHIPSKMSIPEGIEAYKFNVSLYYEKNGVVKEFTVNNYPADDSTWVYKERKVEQINLYTPPIHDFGIMSLPNRQDITAEVLADSGYTFLMIAPRLDMAYVVSLEAAKQWALLSKKMGYRFLCLTASAPSEINRIRKEFSINYDFALMDEITLKTIIRSNPGMMLLKEGVIYAKWAALDFPDPVRVMENPAGFALSDMARRLEKSALYLCSFAFLAIVIYFILFKRKGKTLSSRTKRR